MNNSTSFPLFASLDKNIPKKDLTAKQKQEYIDKVANIDITGKELVYALIMVFYTTTENTLYSDEIPYKGKYGDGDGDKKEITWVFSEFPVRLRHILYKFVKLHEKKMNEEPPPLQNL